MKKAASTAAAIIVTALALLYAFWDVDFPHLLELLSAADYWIILPYLGCLFGFLFFNAVRWRLILRPLGDFSVWQVTPAMMIGFGGNNVLPAHLGELVRTVVFARTYQVSRSSVLTTQVVERMLDVLAILFIYLLAVLTTENFPELIRTGAYVTAAVFLAGCLAIVVFLFFPAAVSGMVERLIAPLPETIRARILALMNSVIEGMGTLKSVPLLLRMIGYSLLKWIASAGAVWVSLWGYGAEVPLSAGMLVVAVGALAVTLPTAPGYFGSIQAAFVFALLPFGIERETALAASIFFLVAQWIPVTLIGGYFFFKGRSGLGGMQAEMSELHRAEAGPN